jgi:hypothetical protein
MQSECSRSQVGSVIELIYSAGDEFHRAQMVKLSV